MPITTSQMPTTNASIQMDSNGDAITTMPAMRLITPTKMDHPRPGSIGSLIAETVVATPRKMNPMPIQMASNRTASPKWRKASTARMSEAAPLMNNRIRPPAETCRLNANAT
ncbi:Uncharacterised protein [Mycobacterium tuberculosis]|nr:Uncharacterised protein [Mycobacterium tuberculosis]